MVDSHAALTAFFAGSTLATSHHRRRLVLRGSHRHISLAAAVRAVGDALADAPVAAVLVSVADARPNAFADALAYNLPLRSESVGSSARRAAIRWCA